MYLNCTMVPKCQILVGKGQRHAHTHTQSEGCGCVDDRNKNTQVLTERRGLGRSERRLSSEPLVHISLASSLCLCCFFKPLAISGSAVWPFACVLFGSHSRSLSLSHTRTRTHTHTHTHTLAAQPVWTSVREKENVCCRG